MCKKSNPQLVERWQRRLARSILDQRTRLDVNNIGIAIEPQLGQVQKNLAFPITHSLFLRISPQSQACLKLVKDIGWIQSLGYLQHRVPFATVCIDDGNQQNDSFSFWPGAEHALGVKVF